MTKRMYYRFQKLSKISLTVSLSFLLFIIAGNFVLAQYTAPGGYNTPGGYTTPGGYSTPGGSPNSIRNFVTSQTFESLINNIAGWIFAIAIPLAVIAIIYAGVLFMTSGGDETKVTTARRALTWSIVGLIVAILGKSFTGIIQNILAPAGGGQNLTGQGVVDILNNLANYIFAFTLVLAVILIIWAGVLFITSSGSDEKITKARKSLLWALVGIAIAITSKGIVMAVASFVTTGR